MKALLMAVILGCLAACALRVRESPDASSFVVGTPEDEAAIRAIVQSQSADESDPHVASDLDWENAFGIRYTDLKKRNAFYGSIVKPQMKDASDSTLEVKVRFVEPTIAVADEYWHVAGQIYSGETKPGPDRWGRTTYFFKKENGAWTEVLERVADLRIPYYKHYSSLPAPVPVSSEKLASYAGRYTRAGSSNSVIVTVNGGLLSIAFRGKTFTGIPSSASEFLVFDPDDLAEYNTVVFGRTADGTLTYTCGYPTGETIAVLTKTL